MMVVNKYFYVRNVCISFIDYASAVFSVKVYYYRIENVINYSFYEQIEKKNKNL